MHGVSKAAVDRCIQSAVANCDSVKTNFDKNQLPDQISLLTEMVQQIDKTI